jgi:hypothetical protein
MRKLSIIILVAAAAAGAVAAEERPKAGEWEGSDHDEMKDDLANLGHPARAQRLDVVTTISREGDGQGWEEAGTRPFWPTSMGVCCCEPPQTYCWRGDSGRRNLVTKYGGTRATEGAVNAGFEWLKEHQEKDGRWAVQAGAEPDKAVEAKDAGLTGLAMLSFLGAGQTQQHGPHKEAMKHATAWLIAHQNKNGLWGDADSPDLLASAIATAALAEAHGMSPSIREITPAAQKAIDGLVAAQAPGAGWGLAPSKGAKDVKIDSLTTIWAGLAAKSAKIAGLKVPGSSFDGVRSWIEHAQDLKDAKPDDATYTGGLVAAYGHMHTPAVADKSRALAAGAGLVRVFWGQHPKQPGVTGPANLLMKGGLPAMESAFSAEECYFATLLMFQKGGENWERWNMAMTSRLLRLVNKEGTYEENKGSWDPAEADKSKGGRTYVTCLAVMSLEAYYRYLPVYMP